MNAPVVAWQRGPLRIVAREEACEHGRPLGVFVFEMRQRDALDGESWVSVDPGEDGAATLGLMCEIVLRIDTSPAWVKKFARAHVDRIESLDSFIDLGGEDGDDLGGDGEGA